MYIHSPPMLMRSALTLAVGILYVREYNAMPWQAWHPSHSRDFLTRTNSHYVTNGLKVKDFCASVKPSAERAWDAALEDPYPWMV